MKWRRMAKGMSNPQGLGRPANPKRHWYRKLYTYRFLKWLWMILKGYRILIDYTVDADAMRFSENLRFVKLSAAQIIGMGYTRGKKIKDEFKYLPFKTYVRFYPDVSPDFPVAIAHPDGTTTDNWETSSTLHDHWKSDSVESFIKGMTTKATLSKGDQTKLIMIFLLVAGACAGAYFIIMG